MTRGPNMWKSIALLSLLAGCDVDIGGGGEAGERVGRIVNRTGATVVLVSPDEWSFGDLAWDADCGSDVLDLFTFVVEGDSLIITATDTTPRPDCRVKTKAEDVTEVSCEGDGDLEQEGELTGISSIDVTGHGAVHLDRLETGTLDLHAGGNGEVSITDLQANVLLLELAGNGSVTLGGAVDEGDSTISGNGDLMAQDLVIQDLLVDVTGDGDGTVTVEGSIGGTTSGSGTLNTYGGAAGVVEVTGSGSVIPHD